MHHVHTYSHKERSAVRRNILGIYGHVLHNPGFSSPTWTIAFLQPSRRPSCYLLPSLAAQRLAGPSTSFWPLGAVLTARRLLATWRPPC